MEPAFQQTPPPLSLKSKKRSLLIDYLASKEKPQLNCEDFQQILNSSPTNLHPGKLIPSLFSFEKVQDENMSQLLCSNKRGFAKSFESRRNPNPSNTPPITPNKPQNPLSLLKNPSTEIDLRPINLKSTPVKCMKKIWNSAFFEKIQLQDLEDPSECIRPLALNTKVEAKAESTKKNSQLIKMKQMRKNSDSKNSTFENYKGPHLAVLKTPKRTSDKSMDLSINSLNSPGKVLVQPNFAHRSLQKHKNTRSFRQDKDSGNLRSFINGLVEKNFGFKQKLLPVSKIEKKTKHVAEKSCENIDKPEDEFQFLSTGYLKYHKNISDKLKISKILVSQHKQERRQTLLLFPPTKKSPSDFN